ncbi:MAG: carbonic anhydrase [Ignavibacteria bacterium]|mgnify:CR=1 FL=1|nr:MAG: carbonic anhydrase [Ignavibacteria bacterium]
MISAHEALALLREGNHRFAAGESTQNSMTFPDRRQDVADAQYPFAVILGCSDSRVPPEIAFDQGLGDLFVIRVAGNIAAPTQIGSIEFAVENFGTPLIVVLGHSGCGAVAGAIQAERDPGMVLTHNLRTVVDRIRPAVQQLAEAGVSEDPEEFSRRAVFANVRLALDHLRRGSSFLDERIRSGALTIAGAVYALEEGTVTFLDDDAARCS